jgi:hypothetical protein
MRRQQSFPWIIVMGGAVLYWTIALGIGIPSLYRLLGPPGPARLGAPAEARCVQAVAVDGTPIVFGDCFNIRFIPDAPEFPRPVGTVHRGVIHHGSSHAGSDLEVSVPTWRPTAVEQNLHDEHHDPQQPEASDSVGRTAF